ncbi:putative copper-activated transcription factor GRISEA [Aspergillus clavatus NRRL 1]|uniref:Copper-activated transcription factor GRISEA, putative n=1 Tax=Aspergillus clavatus (strain ATCC 1007 / CBS 513.65 / DSM 816 / NCTC 3887 / NRRL 1 / QM 1276 / 107) TaxID=344612 RepID=A1CPE2_ASPCL|nr:copper-activated transcription factor GRISEA, putative [Aspergillus clavatus NRRL 1]EAW07513.1 copper-activated transcription factor GRISEA, putative [Aspergillus clavatus NRRL 1]
MTAQSMSMDSSQDSGRRGSTFQPTTEGFANTFNSVPGFDARHGENGSFSNLPSYAPYDAGFGIASNSRDVGNPGNSGVTTPSLMAHQTFNIVKSEEPQEKKGCCTSEAQSSQPEQVSGTCCQRSGSISGTQTPLYQPSLNGTPYTPMSPPQISSWHDFYAADHSGYGTPYTFQHPGLGQSGFVPNYVSHAMSDHSKLGFADNNPFTQTELPRTTPAQTQSLGYCTSSLMNGELKHNCTCGDTCQCLGCASHPFNNTTRQHVQEMGLLVTLDGEESSFDGLNGYHDFSSRGTPSSAPLDYHFNRLNHFGHGTDPMATHNGSDKPVQNGGSPSASYASDQHLMVPSEYYTIEYPVKLPNACSNASGSCLCGSDCSCVGCLTHNGHNGVAIETGMMESNDLTPLSPSMEHEGVASSHMPILKGTPAHSPNPML